VIGQATSADKHEYGFAKVRTHNHSSLLNDIVDEVNTKGHGLLDVWMSHGIEDFVVVNVCHNYYY
jgi:GMP synthase (glutamine-hydrolysing)